MNKYSNRFPRTNKDLNSYRILIISPFPPPYGGMANQARKMVDNLKKDGVVVSTCKTNPDFPKKFMGVSKIPGLRTIVRTFFFIHDLIGRLPEVDIVYLLSGFKWFFLWITFPAILIIKLYGKKIIISGRGGAAEDFFKRWKILGKFVLKLTDEITVPSGFLQGAFYRTLGYSPKIVPNIIDLDLFQWKSRNKIYPRLISTRNLEKIYNIECIIRAFTIVKGHYPSAELAIVGDGLERHNLNNLVKSLDIDDVKFYGSVPHAKLPKLYDKYDIFLNASNVDNFPGSIIESFASGLPVISTKSGGVPYIIDDGRTGFLIDMNNHEQMAKKVLQLIENPDLALQIVQNARKECEQYSWDAVKEKFFETIMCVMA